MSISFNLRHLEKRCIRLTGEAAFSDLDLDSRDELIRFCGPVTYELEVQKVERGVLVQGALSVEVECDCARCLKTFAQPIALQPWTVYLPLAGDDAVRVDNDCVDLTPYLREDILLALPQHPLCAQDCQGLLREYGRVLKSPTAEGMGESRVSPWGDLDKLDL